ncbi:C2 domain-containing protein 2 isoform X2 [Protopterus annectens]|uniref:C2 domain-containing protein 2 isoform X2 n=1 Tax=Protopterus annectens TaxID=7888 RepID=UPI001CFB45ED|nr:C2 domain-containing protein 2 isoform X2 [Protopterus annectens]
MSWMDSVTDFLSLGEIQWLSLVTLFIASIVTVVIYLIHYAVRMVWGREGRRRMARSTREGLSEELDPLLNWVMSLNSWRSQWQKAWLTSLNREAKIIGTSLQIVFQEEDGPQPLELQVNHVSSVIESKEENVVSCDVTGDSMQLFVNVREDLQSTMEPVSYGVKISPLYLQLVLHLKTGNEEIQVQWFLRNLADVNIMVQPKSVLKVSQKDPHFQATLKDALKVLLKSVQPSAVLIAKPGHRTESQTMQNAKTSSQASCPPKPPRAHELRLLVKNIKVSQLIISQAAGNINTTCSLHLNEPQQTFCSSVSKSTTSPSWDQQFVFELNAHSKELCLRLSDNNKPAESAFIGEACIPLDLFKKQPSGLQTFALKGCPNRQTDISGSLSAEFHFLEPSGGISRQLPTPVPARKVEMDRTVMPCGTVVTTVTAVKTKPRPDGHPTTFTSDSPSRSPAKANKTEREKPLQVYPSHCAPVSKTLSSSDTELLMLKGTDPVAEAAIRQLQESAKQSLKSPRKKSTIIISGVSKIPVAQDDEVSLMMGYAASMDSPQGQEDSLTTTEESAPVVPTTSNALSMTFPKTLSSSSSQEEGIIDDFSADNEMESFSWEDYKCGQTSGNSLNVLETATVKKPKGGFLRKSARLFFRRRHPLRSPGMSQSHNDLVYLQQPPLLDKEKKGGTLSRIMNKKFMRNKSRSKLNALFQEAST